MITNDRLQEALDYLASTDERFARAKTRVSVIEHKMDICKSQGFLKADGNIEERKSLAKTSDDYIELVHEYKLAKTEVDLMATKRRTEEMNIDVWRTWSANRRQGQF